GKRKREKEKKEDQEAARKVREKTKDKYRQAGWVNKDCAHCAIFPTAASRRSLDRVSVPVWLVILSDQLGIVA
ncbi:hypothetical protein BJK31_10365, partial [Escherichia coli]